VSKYTIAFLGDQRGKLNSRRSRVALISENLISNTIKYQNIEKEQSSN